MSPPPVSRRRALAQIGGAVAAVGGLVGGLRYLTSPAPRPRVAAGTQRVVEQYGPGRRQLGEWWVPPGAGSGPLPTVVLVHGGYWRAQYDRSLEDALSADLAGRGYLVWNLEYAASDSPWPATLTDVALGYDHLGTGRFADRVDPARVAVAGHSAGGHLALWLASRAALPAGAPGAVPPGRPGWPQDGVGSAGQGPPPVPPARGSAPRPALCVAQAPVAALAEGSRQGLGGGAVDALVGGTPDQVPERYAVADPEALLPSFVPTVLVHAEGDDTVPIAQSERYSAAVREKGGQARVVRVPGGHFEHLDPRSEAVQALRDALVDL